MNPTSSPSTENTKSVCLAGRNSSAFCVPRRKPFPEIPPDPIAIFDWKTCHPSSSRFDPGSRKLMIRSCW